MVAPLEYGRLMSRMEPIKRVATHASLFAVLVAGYFGTRYAANRLQLPPSKLINSAGGVAAVAAACSFIKLSRKNKERLATLAAALVAGAVAAKVTHKYAGHHELATQFVAGNAATWSLVSGLGAQVAFHVSRPQTQPASTK